MENKGSSILKHSESVNSTLNWLRAGVLGANDGIVSISGLLIGVAAVDPTHTSAIVIAGLAGIASAALSMSVGEYVSVSTQRDTERTLVHAQRNALSTQPQQEEATLAAIWEAKGLDPKLAAQVAQQLSIRDPLNAHLSSRYNIDPSDLTNPWTAALSSFVAFLAGSLLPLLTMVFVPAQFRIVSTFVAVLIALMATGYISALLGQAPRLRAVIRLVAGGCLAMILTFIIGHFFGVSI